MTISNDSGGIGAVGGNAFLNAAMYPGLSGLINAIAMPIQVSRQLYTYYAAPNNERITFPYEDGTSPETAQAPIVGEDDEIPMDTTKISTTSVSMKKAALGHQISAELQQFSQIPIIQERLIRQAIRIGNKVDNDGWTAITAAASTNDITATGESLGFDGTSFTRVGTIGQMDIVNAKSKIMQKNYIPTVLAVNPIGWSMLSKLPMYKGDCLYGAPVYQTGELGNIEGLRVMVSQNVPANTAYVIAAGTNDTVLGQYSPMGFYAEATALTTMVAQSPSTDGYRVYSKTVYAHVVVREKAISEITYTGTA